jgi:hypothetical protein
MQRLVVLGTIGLWVVLVTALASAFDYYRRFARVPQPGVTEFARAREKRTRAS